MTKILTDDQFGKNLRNLRESQGMSQYDLVKKLHLLGSPLSRSNYSLIEMGKGNIFINDLLALKQIFNVEYTDFFKDIPLSRELHPRYLKEDFEDNEDHC